MSIDMEYGVHFSLTIHSFDGTKAASLGKKMLLPFVPFLGLRLQGELSASEPVNAVTWSQTDQQFSCHIDSYELDMNDGYDLDLAFLIEQAKADDWEGEGRIYEINS
jgi:hypothetical protein